MDKEYRLQKVSPPGFGSSRISERQREARSDYVYAYLLHTPTQARITQRLEREEKVTIIEDTIQRTVLPHRGDGRHITWTTVSPERKASFPLRIVNTAPAVTT